MNLKYMKQQNKRNSAKNLTTIKMIIKSNQIKSEQNGLYRDKCIAGTRQWNNSEQKKSTVTITGEGSTRERKKSDYRDDLLCGIRIIRGLVCQQTNFAGASISKINSVRQTQTQRQQKKNISLRKFIVCLLGQQHFFSLLLRIVYKLCCHQYHSKDCF